MSNLNLSGTILEITQPKSFIVKDKEVSYKTVVIDVGKNIIAANWWSEDALPEEGSKVCFTVEVRSERNNKTPKIFYHKLNLKSIYESDSFYPKI